MESRVLAIDYGERRIGISISDPTNLFATTLDTIENSKDSIKKIAEITEAYSVKLILVGYPLNMNGTPSKLCSLIDEFIDEMQKLVNIQIIRRDERLSSYTAQKKILETVKSKKRRRDKSLIDKFSAATILQDYLDEKN
ncbi:MAG: Holliday junction resolvase RuvX [Ignavibacteria bacterium]|nr:Holliday junction resolvase RuvX [Ignavibacteria bacterium]